MTDTTLTVFSRQFPAITQMVERSEIYKLDFVLPTGIGSAAAVLVRRRNGCGFFMMWDLLTARLHGLRSRCFDGTKPDDHPANADLLGELARRLSVDGATFD
ncbi:hypothetical protein A1351_23205 [Methylosinus sp. R-45379]|uniref:hypothetical protein n=1 Tax=Methylosinus sp. R-45379 TaxID=980563 RepID=UPI0007C96B36|nr:hypothetical protein [Methylosinus sp. R-45379]OAI29930.1 hypothetical protein A1351_23205 [Methylosinus sp. R-45379]